ncbi:NADH-quinone oxidoreductase subunit N [Sphingobacterium bovistauri]|uniref:NADH-quinone oxidoreductase subunit N n=1 Tax=Sphingobacterium bovistauri TaxID=2781959 RepID=A0ABS7Z8M9_9SPHI|nr:NADH-quinone oxidoreductase subunit N [Sphingobacterium bovistauri]MCA5006515.1 NADH-quinone oxidoreductase subunit N [Sphingobacterium bovistauri]
MQDINTQLPSILDQVIQSIPFFKAELALIFAFLGSIIATLFLDKLWKQSSFIITLIGIVSSFVLATQQFGQPQSGFFGMLIIDNFSVYSRGIILAALLICVVFIQQHFQYKTFGKNLGDVYSILLAAGLGINLLTSTTNWLLAFIAIETVSISSYILVGYFSENKRQTEASMKYVLFGSVSAAVMLYGLSLLYGFTGNLDFTSFEHIQGLIEAPKILLSVALLFMFTGLGFKLSFVPFHVWSPDVYEGAPTPVTAFLSTVPKIGAIILLARLFEEWTSSSFYFSELVLILISVASITTMLIGNLVALRQSNIKRMMAYSSIGHTGFLLMALVGNLASEPQVLLFYIAVYTIMNLAVFGLIDVMEQKIGSVQLENYQGLGKQFPITFSIFTLLGISLIGLPPTAGFIGKLFVFTSIFDLFQFNNNRYYLILLVVGALTSVISLFYYFKIPLYAFLRKGDEVKILPTKSTQIVYIISIILGITTLLLGIFPNLLLTLFK